MVFAPVITYVTDLAVAAMDALGPNNRMAASTGALHFLICLHSFVVLWTFFPGLDIFYLGRGIVGASLYYRRICCLAANAALGYNLHPGNAAALAQELDQITSSSLWRTRDRLYPRCVADPVRLWRGAYLCGFRGGAVGLALAQIPAAQTCDREREFGIDPSMFLSPTDRLQLRRKAAFVVVF